MANYYVTMSNYLVIAIWHSHVHALPIKHGYVKLPEGPGYGSNDQDLFNWGWTPSCKNQPFLSTMVLLPDRVFFLWEIPPWVCWWVNPWLCILYYIIFYIILYCIILYYIVLYYIISNCLMLLYIILIYIYIYSNITLYYIYIIMF